MAHPAAGTIRSPRSRALEIGTDPGKFDADPNYDAQAGHPRGLPGMPAGTYADAADAAKPTPAAKPHDTSKPFNLGG